MNIQLSVKDADDLSGWLAASMEMHGLVQIVVKSDGISFQCNPMDSITFSKGSSQ